MRFPTTIAAALLTCLACSKTSTSEQPAPKPPAQPKPAPKQSASATASSEPPSPEALPPGCWDSASTDAGSGALLDALLAACTPETEALLPKVFEVELTEGQRKDVPFTVTDAGKCVRLVAVGDGSVHDIELRLLDREDGEHGKDTLPGRIALANPRGPICLPEPGLYRAAVEVSRGKGKVRVQVMSAK